MTMKRILPAACVAAFMSAGSAHAFLIDFTDDSFWGPGTVSTPATRSYGALGGFDVRLTAYTDGTLSTTTDLEFEAFGSTAGAGFCDDNGGALDCDTDGGGVDGDELTRTGVDIRDTEAVLVEFFETGTTTAKAIEVTGFHFLDMFENSDGINEESALVRFDGVGPLSEYGADAPFGDPFGYKFASESRLVETLLFGVGELNDDTGEPDYALAGIGVVPLPAAGWLLVGAFGGLYGARRLKKKS